MATADEALATSQNLPDFETCDDVSQLMLLSDDNAMEVGLGTGRGEILMHVCEIIAESHFVQGTQALDNTEARLAAFQREHPAWYYEPPPTNNRTWRDSLLQPFHKMAAMRRRLIGIFGLQFILMLTSAYMLVKGSYKYLPSDILMTCVLFELYGFVYVCVV